MSFNPSAKIIWVKGPYKGAPSDIRIASEALVPALRQRGEKMLADKGYLGERDVLVCPIKEYANIPLTQHDRSFNRKLKSIRQIIERVNKRLKHFNAISHVWRHDHSLNGRCFHIVARYKPYLFNRTIVNLYISAITASPPKKSSMDYQNTFAILIQRVLGTKFRTRDRVVRAFFVCYPECMESSLNQEEEEFRLMTYL